MPQRNRQWCRTLRPGINPKLSKLAGHSRLPYLHRSLKISNGLIHLHCFARWLAMRRQSICIDIFYMILGNFAIVCLFSRCRRSERIKEEKETSVRPTWWRPCIVWRITSRCSNYQVLWIDAECPNFARHECFAQCLFRFYAGVHRLQGPAFGLILIKDQVHARYHSFLVVSERERERERKMNIFEYRIPLLDIPLTQGFLLLLQLVETNLIIAGKFLEDWSEAFRYRIWDYFEIGTVGHGSYKSVAQVDELHFDIVMQSRWSSCSLLFA